MLTRLLPLLISSPAPSSVAGLGLSSVDVSLKVTHHVRLPGDGGRTHHAVVVGHVAACLQGESGLGQTSEDNRVLEVRVGAAHLLSTQAGLQAAAGQVANAHLLTCRGRGIPH